MSTLFDYNRNMINNYQYIKNTYQNNPMMNTMRSQSPLYAIHV